MSRDSIQTIVHEYYDAWAAQKREAVRELLDENLDFRSPQDRFTQADPFLAKCWVYSEGLTSVHYLREVYSGDQAFVILSWEMEDGSRFAGAEYIRIGQRRISQILVVNNSPEFRHLVE